MKEKQILYFGNHKWDILKQRPQYMCESLSKLGYKVYYIEPFSYFIVKTKEKIRHINERLTVLTPKYSLVLRFNKVPLLSKINAYLLYISYLIYKKKLNINPDAVIFTYPSYAHISCKFKNVFKIYDIMDDYSEIGQYFINYQSIKKYVRFLEKKMVGASDLIISSSDKLIEKSIEDYKIPADKILLLPNAIDLSNYPKTVQPAEKIEVLRKNYKKVVGFIGAIHTWIDLDIIHNAAKRNKDLLFVMAGPYIENYKDAYSLDNLVFTGMIPHSEVLSYIQSFDICLIPFKVNKLTDGVDPVKFYEYLYLRKPILSSRTKTMVSHDKFCSYYSSLEEFEGIIRGGISVPDDKEAGLFLEKHDWLHVCGLLKGRI